MGRVAIGWGIGYFCLYVSVVPGAYQGAGSHGLYYQSLVARSVTHRIERYLTKQTRIIEIADLFESRSKP